MSDIDPTEGIILKGTMSSMTSWIRQNKLDERGWRDFHGGPVVRLQAPNARVLGSIPGQRPKSTCCN